MASLKITLKRSVIGRPGYQVETVKSLGLHKIGDTREINDTPALRGMVNTVKHLLEVHE
ncbi:50S ribosomal protein L30 [Deinococcus koreensis]|uniref:Large ribosomal subunit protein uL30 n=1 Tax=Deinococcus koreensis TaxID=2054903 RepID=A0A2K3UZY3_9DEIO|nr:50S ribosomal protein L30 [Deinococcus koreensis]PNY82108.1 50S ribosomal protein L30 [Deinococcus koreensis]